ncbi:type I DNA topoisomerase [Chloroflexota bacterium]
MNLVIVESPAKAKTISNILGNGYTVMSSVGHIRDLPDTRLGIAISDNFRPFYLIDRNKLDLITELRDKAAASDAVYLATDHDREGEAIAWHLVQAINPDATNYQRIHFHEVTRNAVLEAIKNPGTIDMNTVNAQQARRILDRLVGYKLSPLIGRRVRRGLTAGRVQSIAVRLIVDREREIVSFKPEEYWTIFIDLAVRATGSGDTPIFRAKLDGHGDGSPLQLNNETVARETTEKLAQASHSVTKISKHKLKRASKPPFITSSLQQEAWHQLHFSAKKTMQVAQQLYEGLDIGEEDTAGLITYMRTDDVTVADSARDDTRKYIHEKYGTGYLPESARAFRSRVKGTQEGHEAIRPTDIFRELVQIQRHLNDAQYKLYELIWKRMVASQMNDAVFARTTVEINADTDGNGHNLLLRVTSTETVFPGFMTIYSETNDDGDSDTPPLPPLTQGDNLKFVEILPLQHFTQSPPRYNEASLVKIMEEKGIGRPSTYAPTISNIQRQYIVKQRKGLQPTEAANVVTALLVEYFPTIIDVDFTSGMESKLDTITRGKVAWTDVLTEFWGPFSCNLEYANANMPRVKLPDRVTTEICSVCLEKYGITRYLVVKKGPVGPFLGCPGFGDEQNPCEFRKPYAINTGIPCPIPDCDGELLERMSQKGMVFYGCSNFPTCKFTAPNKPLPDPCLVCGGLVTAYQAGKGKCINRHITSLETEDSDQDTG